MLLSVCLFYLIVISLLRHGLRTTTPRSIVRVYTEMCGVVVVCKRRARALVIWFVVRPWANIIFCFTKWWMHRGFPKHTMALPEL